MLKLANTITILAIDTSCDETAVAVTRGAVVLANSLFSQLEMHKEFGGVVPSIARLAHIEKFDSVLQEALDGSGLTLQDIDAVAVTQGPGLAIALEVGINKAKELAAQLNIPLLAINHMEGHLLSAITQAKQSAEIEVEFPALGLLVSGGHTEFVEVEGITHYRKLGGTVDDACGEAYDKCARMLGLPYPGGPLISQLAAQHRGEYQIRYEKDNKMLLARAYRDNAMVCELPVPMANSGDLMMSFSGLKTAVKRLIESKLADIENLSDSQIAMIAVVFEAAAIKMLTLKLEQAIAGGDFHEVWLGGGVVASDYFRSEVARVCSERGLQVRMPANKKLMTDNAAMIGVAAGLKVNQILQENAVAKLAELNEKALAANGIYLQSSEFSLLERDPILSF